MSEDINNRKAVHGYLGRTVEAQNLMRQRGLLIPAGVEVLGNFAFEAPVEMQMVSIRFSCVGSHTYIGANSKIFYADIGRFCSIADDVIIGPNSHPGDRITTSAGISEEQFTWFSPCSGRY